jgi:hypothetical protein
LHLHGCLAVNDTVDPSHVKGTKRSVRGSGLSAQITPSMLGPLNPSPLQYAGTVFKGNEILPVRCEHTQHSMAYDVHDMRLHLTSNGI